MSKSTEIIFVHPDVWRSYESTKLARLGEKERLYAQALLTEFHNRHIGIPVGLAASLSLALTTVVAASKLNSPWKETRKRMETDLAASQKAAGGAPQVSFSGAVLFNAAPAYVLHRIAMPLVQVACQMHGKCFLFSEDEETDTSITAQELDQYEAHIITNICRLAEEQSGKAQLNLFWKDSAAILSTYSSPFTRHKALPDPDPLASAFVFRLDELPQIKYDYEHLERIHLRRNRHRARQLHEEGVAGITQTRSLDVLQRMLISEIINPDPMLADRLLNTGYLVVERLPRSERLRDALIIAFLPPEMQQRPAADFLRACWMNVAAVLFQVLLHNHLHDSQIMWVEGESDGSFFASTISVEELRYSVPRVKNLEVGHNPAFRSGFLNLTRWLPDYFDRRKERRLLDLESDGAVSGPEDWLGRVWRTKFSQKRVLPASPANGSQSAQVIETAIQLETLVDQFAYVHVMTFLPIELIPEMERDDPQSSVVARRVARELDTEEHEGFYQSMNWLHNSSFTKAEQGLILCEYLGAVNQQMLGWGGNLLPGDLPAAAVKLEQTWLEEIIREMQRD